MIPITLSPAELLDILVALGARSPDAHKGYTGNQRLALRAKLEALMEEEEK